LIEELIDRERTILKLLSERGSLSVSLLSRELGVSEVTVRSDLKELEERGYLVRSRGGAYPAMNQSIVERQQLRIEEKNRIARAAADLVQDGDTIMIVAGTTTALVPKFLLGKGNIHIVTDSTLLFPWARSNPALDLTVVGGEFRGSTESFIGPIAMDAIRRFNVKLAFISADGFSIERGLTTHIVEGAEMVKAMTAQADRCVLLADSSKYGRSGFVTIMPLDSVDTLITDSELDAAQAALLQELGLELIIV
jgi:DeoR family galactitol utilization operon repressor